MEMIHSPMTQISIGRSLKFTIFFIFLISGCAQIEIAPIAEDVKDVFQKNIVTDKDIVTAFKNVLEDATVKSVDLLSSANGFANDNDVAIPFPPEALKLEQTLRKVGFSSVCDEFSASINLAAESAVAEAKPLFLEAIKNITFADAKKLLNGGNNAITLYLQEKTTPALVSKFNPVVEHHLEQNKATNSWNKMVAKYNKLPMVKPVQLDLSQHVTQKTIEGLFFYISKEEAAIRKDPAKRTTALIKKVFSQVD